MNLRTAGVNPAVKTSYSHGQYSPHTMTYNTHE